MQSEGEEHLLDEIRYLTNLIQSHKGHSRSAQRITNVSPVSCRTYDKKKILHKKTAQRFQPVKHSSYQTITQHPKNFSQSHLNTSNNILTKAPPLHTHVDYNPVSVESNSAHQHVFRAGSDKHVSRNITSMMCNPTMSKTKQRHVLISPHSMKADSPKTPTHNVIRNQVSKGTTQRKRVGNSLKKSKRRHLPARNQLSWKRKSIDSTDSSSQPVQSTVVSSSSNQSTSSVAKSSCPSTKQQSPRRTPTTNRTTTSSGVNIYKWRRLSSDSNSVSKVPLVPQASFKTFQTSIRRKYSYIRHSPQMKLCQKSRKFSRKLSNSYSKKRRKDLMKGHATGRSKNRVWIANTSLGSSTRSPNRCVQRSPSSPFSGLLAGRETKTRQGNRQWTSNRQLQLAQRSLRKAAVLSSVRKASLVSLEKGDYVMDSSKKRLKKVDSTIAVVKKRPQNALAYHVSMEASVKRIRANHVIEKSKRYVWHARKSNQGSKKYCMFFNKFGKCNKGEKCAYIHDPDKVSVCRKYLKGLCEKTDQSCLLSHKITKEKMPVCSFFLRGVCVREGCPYLHVSVGKDADICMDFVKGYCPKGEKCVKKHILDCPEFTSAGRCPRGKGCPLRHHNRVLKSVHRVKASSQPSCSLAIKQPKAFGKVQRKLQRPVPYDCSKDHDQDPYNPQELSFIPLETNSAPDFIAL